MEGEKTALEVAREDIMVAELKIAMTVLLTKMTVD
jgi:hypothetical protein